MYMTYEELKSTDSYEKFNESSVKQNYKFLMDIMDMRYCNDEIVLLWVGKHRVNVAEIYNDREKREMEFYQKYLDEWREERKREQKEYEEQKENEWLETMLDTSTIVKSVVATTTYELNLENRQQFIKDCMSDGIYYSSSKYVYALIYEKIDKDDDKLFVRYLNGMQEPYDENNPYHVALKKHILSNL